MGCVRYLEFSCNARWKRQQRCLSIGRAAQRDESSNERTEVKLLLCFGDPRVIGFVLSSELKVRDNFFYLISTIV